MMEKQLGQAMAPSDPDAPLKSLDDAPAMAAWPWAAPRGPRP